MIGGALQIILRGDDVARIIRWRSFCKAFSSRTHWLADRALFWPGTGRRGGEEEGSEARPEPGRGELEGIRPGRRGPGLTAAVPLGAAALAAPGAWIGTAKAAPGISKEETRPRESPAQPRSPGSVNRVMQKP